MRWYVCGACFSCLPGNNDISEQNMKQYCENRNGADEEQMAPAGALAFARKSRPKVLAQSWAGCTAGKGPGPFLPLLLRLGSSQRLCSQKRAQPSCPRRGSLPASLPSSAACAAPQPPHCRVQEPLHRLEARRVSTGSTQHRPGRDGQAQAARGNPLHRLLPFYQHPQHECS